jgi:hypothetical protein
LAGWVATVLAQQIMRSERRPAELRGAIRRLKVLLARQPDWDPRRVFYRSARERVELWLAQDERQAWREVHAETDLLLTVGEMLLGADAPHERREKTLVWLRTIGIKDDPLGTFERDVGLSLDAMFAEWRQWLAARNGLPYDPLPAENRWLLADVALPTLENQALPIALRQRMARSLGYFYVSGASMLIEALADPKIELRREAAEALELASGELGGDNASRWQSWWDALPPEARGESDNGVLAATVATAVQGDWAPVAEIAAEVGRRTTGSPPAELRNCWGLMVAGGLIAILIPISMLFLIGPIIYPMVYYSLFVGVMAIVRGAARDTLGLRKLAKMQMGNILLCDAINVILGVIEWLLLRRPHVQQYLLEVNGGRT